RGAQTGVAGEPVVPRRAPEGEGLELQMRQAGGDDDGQRAEDSDPEDDRKTSDGVDAPQQKQDDDDADDGGGDGDVFRGGGKNRFEVLGKADAARRERERRADEDLKEK